MTTNKVTNSEKPLGVEFLIGGLTGIGTGLLTNPADVLKTRLQLQGELSAPGTYRRIYNGTLHAACTIIREESIFALQAGIVPVLGIQIIINTIRLGSYNFAKRLGLTLNDKGDTDVLRTAILGGCSGTIAVVIGSPLYLAKIKLQAHSGQKNLFNNKPLNTRIILKSVWQEGGFKSLYRDWNANIPRLFIGSAVHFSTFGVVTDWLKTIDIFSERPLLVAFIGSIIGGTFMSVTVHPFDVMATRLYNQRMNQGGNSPLYNGMYDTLSKIVRTESFFGLYKGFFPNFLRLAPYVIISQVLFEKITLIYYDFEK